MDIVYSPRFARAYRKLPVSIRSLIKAKEKLFRLTPFHASLQTHKLNGVLSGLYAFSIGQKYRIIFELDARHEKAYLHDVGGHEVY
jgi:mRNA-degrading endonuclease RelE of RelBE toxin-antitoxin system